MTIAPDVTPVTTPRTRFETGGYRFEPPSERPGSAVALRSVCVRHAGTTVLHDVNVDVEHGELVAVAGPSGSGKTTLLRTIAGLSRPSAGTVRVGDRTASPADGRPLGYVPQDDIVHLGLSLERVMRHAAALRTAGNDEDRQQRVDDVLATLGIADRRDVEVRRLSGGERKRASIAVELLSAPELFLLDEPTSGLDPSAAATLMAHLRGLADAGTTIVLTTHAPADLERCDRVIFLGADGQVAFTGTAVAARHHFGVEDLSAVYGQLDQDGATATNGRRVRACTATCAETAPVVDGALRNRRPDVRRALTQWWALTRRNADLLVSNRLTLTILLGSPALVILMIATLFPTGVFDRAGSATTVQQVYWITFAGFFFGLTAGLLQIAVELPIVRRDRVAGVGAGTYVSAKLAVLTPFLLTVTVAMLATLRSLDRLPSLGAGTWIRLTVTVLLVALAALSIGLLASAAVTDTTQATLALPMICFPQVLFAGSLVATQDMTWIGRTLSTVLATRWGFESIGRGLRVGETFPADSELRRFTPALDGSPFIGWGWLTLIALSALIGTYVVVRRRTRPRA